MHSEAKRTVMPAKAGIQQRVKASTLDTGFRRYDDNTIPMSGY
jgi:hypothetical protein